MRLASRRKSKISASGEEMRDSGKFTELIAGELSAEASRQHFTPLQRYFTKVPMLIRLVTDQVHG